MTSPRDLALMTRAHRAIAEAKTIDEIRELRDKAAAVKAYAKKVKLGQQIVIEASSVKIHAERKLGEMLREMKLANSAPGNQYTGPQQTVSHDPDRVTLRDLGVTKSESSRSQQIADLPQDVVDAYIAESTETLREPTTAGLLRLAKRLRAQPAPEPATAPTSQLATHLDQLLSTGQKFSTIYADPPWSYNNQATRGATDDHYPTMTVDEICDEPVEQLCQDQSHLHLWTTNAFLPDAFDVIEAWGFTYKSCFVWVKPQMGLGNYWRVSHEFLLLGVRGKLPFQDKGIRSWLECERTEHSRKPPSVRRLIEKVSPGPYLEMYGRDSPVNELWTVHGNQIQ
jgi:N6-adenosine-specific RNA methylase IME4